MTDALWRIIIRSTLRRPFQSALFVLGVALGVAMIVSIDIANGSALRSFGLFTETIAGHTTHQIIGGPTGLPDSLYRRLKIDLAIRDAAPIVDNYVRAVELDNQPIHLFGVDPFAEAPFRGYLNLGATNSNTSLDAMTAFLTQPNQILIAEALAQRYKLKPGDHITLQYGVNKYTVTIAALLRPGDDPNGQSLQDLLITDISTAQELLGMVGRLTSIDLIIPEGATGDATLAKIQAILPQSAIIQPATARSDAISQMTSSFQLSLTALSLLALVVGMFLIYNTVTFSVVQRRPMIGTLRALGVTRRQIFAMILSEAALLSAIGALIGIVAGIVMGRLAVAVVTRTISNLYFTVTVRNVSIPIFTLIKGAAIGIGAALGAALIPAYEATTTPPTGTFKRSDIENKVRRAVPAATLIGSVLVIVSGIALSFQNTVISFAGLFGIVIGCSLFTPLIALALMSVIRPITGAILGALGRMAPRSIIRSLSRTSVAVAALMVAVSVIVGVSAMVGSFRNNVYDWLTNTIRADILISPPSITATRQESPVNPLVAVEVSNTPGVAEVDVARNVSVTRPGDPLPVYLNAIDKDVSHGHRRFVWAIGDYDAVWKAMGDGAVAVTEAFARHRNILVGPGQSLTLHTDHGDRSFPIAAFTVDYTSDQGSVLMREPIYRAAYDDRAISTIGVFVAPGTDIDALINTLRAKFAGREDLVIQSNRQLLTSVLSIFDQTFAITTALNLLATVVAFIGILSALMALQLERTRELGTMRANGMTRRQLFQMTLLETGLMGAIAGVMAVPVGTVLAWVLVYIINARAFGWTLELQLRPEFYAQAMIVSLLAALLAGIYPALRMGRIQPAVAVRSE